MIVDTIGRRSIVFALGLIAVFFAVFVAIFSPVVLNGYFIREDYTFLEYIHVEPQLEKHLVEGRVIEYFLKHVLMSSFIDSSESTKRIRMAAIVGLVLLALVLYSILRRSGFHRDHSLLVCILICTLPPLQILVLFMLILPSIYACALSLLAALVLYVTTDSRDHDKPVYKQPGIIISSLLLLVSLNINQPPAMMFWAAGVILLLGNYEEPRKMYQYAWRQFFVGFSTMALYFIFFVKLLPRLMEVERKSRAGLVGIADIPEKLMLLLSLPLKTALNLWNIKPTATLGVCFFVVICTGLIISAVADRRRNNKSWSAIKYCLIIFMAMLCYLPNIVVASNIYPSHTIVSLSAVLALLFCFGVIRIFMGIVSGFGLSERWNHAVITIVLLLMAVTSSAVAHKQVKRQAELLASELEYVKNAIRSYGTASLYENPRVYLRVPREKAGFLANPYKQFDGQLGTFTTNPEWVVIAEAVVKTALHELRVEHPVNIIIVMPEARFLLAGRSLVIDMTVFPW